MNKKIRIYLPIILLLLLISSCSYKHNQWCKTTNGDMIFVSNHNYIYKWEGGTFEGLIHGQGTLKIYEGNSLVQKLSTNAYYGTIDKTNIIYVNDTTQYIGNTKRNKQDGFGVLIQSHNLFIGEFLKSKPHGELTWYQNKKLRYKGSWEKGCMEGYGTRYDKDGIYVGTFKKNLYEGYGSKSYYNGTMYDGEWSKGQRKGYGNLYTNEFTYSGSFKNNLPDGDGCLTIGDSIFTYNGNWTNGKMCNYGECIYSNGDIYEGEWQNNSFNGFGVCKYIFGDLYEGDWKDGLQNGKGKYTSKDFIYVGDWENGWINGEGQMNFSNGDWYEGDFHQNERFGIGCYHFKNGNFYEGEFVNDVINGLGIFHFKDGSRYEGEFEDGKIFGDGTLHINVNGENIAITAFWDGTHNLPTEASVLFENGDLYEGTLKNGFPTSDGVWSTQEERESGKSFMGKANDFYKEHRDTWNKIVVITSTVLTAVEISATIIGGPTVKIIGIAAGISNKALNDVDASIAITSAGYDVTEAYKNGEDPTDIYKTLAKEVGINAAFILVPKGLKALPTNKMAAKLSIIAAKKVASNIAKETGKQVSRVSTKIAATSATKAASIITKGLRNKSKRGFQKIVQIGKSESGKLEKRFLNSKAGQKYHQIYKSFGKKTSKIKKDIAEAKARNLIEKEKILIEKARTLNKKDATKLVKKNKTIKQAIDHLDPKLGIKTEDLIFKKCKDGSHIITWKKFPETSIRIKENTIYAKGGSTIKNGNLNQFLNEPMPNKNYIIDDCFHYKTDADSRVIEAHANRTKAYNSLDRSKQRNSDVQKKVIKDLDGRKGDDGGHIFANNTNGPNELINQVPMEHKIQANGEWRKFEQMEEKAIKEGNQVHSSRKLLYKGNSKRPYAIEAKVVINGKTFTQTIKI